MPKGEDWAVWAPDIIYRDGSEELYDQNTDPGKYTNLGLDTAYREIVDQFAKWLPVTPTNYQLEIHEKGDPVLIQQAYIES